LKDFGLMQGTGSFISFYSRHEKKIMPRQCLWIGLVH